jgi:uncharacterized protein YbaA (DUF1428 family)
MPEYIDGFVIVVPKKKLAEYKKQATAAKKIWMEYGALDYRECVSEELKVKMGLPFHKLTKAKPSEVIIFAWITYKSKKQRDAVNKKVMADPRIEKLCDPENPPFDMTRFSYGGFETLVK